MKWFARVTVALAVVSAVVVSACAQEPAAKVKPKVEYYWIQPYYTKDVTQERETYASENINQHWFLHKNPIERTPQSRQNVLMDLEKGGAKCLAFVVDGRYRGWRNVDKSNIEQLDKELGIFSEPSPPDVPTKDLSADELIMQKLAGRGCDFRRSAGKRSSVVHIQISQALSGPPFNFSGSITGDDLKELKNLTNINSITELSFRCASSEVIAESGIKELSKLKNFTTLFIESSSCITDAGFKELTNLENLTTVQITNGSITNNGLKDLKNLKNIRTLLLYGTQINDEGLKELKDLKSLTSLTVYQFSKTITDEALKNLKELKSLTTLALTGSDITDAGLKELKEFKNLTTLNLSGTQITDAGIRELSEFEQLTTLVLSDTQITDAGLKELAGLQNLTTLVSLSVGPGVTNDGLKELRHFKHLEQFDLPRTRITDAGLFQLSDLKNLSSLNITNTRITKLGRQILSESNPNVKFIQNDAVMPKSFR